MVMPCRWRSRMMLCSLRSLTLSGLPAAVFLACGCPRVASILVQIFIYRGKWKPVLQEKLNVLCWGPVCEESNVERIFV